MKEKMKVCLLNDSFPPVIDGVANAVINYANIIQKQYGEAVVATPWYPGAVDTYHFPVVRYKSFNIAPGIGYRAGYPLDADTLRLLDDYEMDIIHCHCPVASVVLARMLRETKHIPIVFTYHTKFDVAIKESITARPMQQLAIKWLVHNIEACDDVWVVSKGAGENLRSLGYKGTYIVMRNGADFVKGKVARAEVEKVRKQYGIEGEIPLFLFVGRMMWYKGIKLSLDSLKEVKKAGQKFKMFFVGDGLEFEEIKDYVEAIGLQDVCIFVGAVQEREVLRTYFSMCHLFLFPSTFDTNGIVVTEAAACETASIVLTNSCASEGIIDAHNGFLVKDDVAQMSTKILWACEHMEELKQIGRNAMEEIYLSWDDAIAIAYKRYREIVEQFDFEQTKQIEGWDEEIYSLAAEAYEKMRLIQELPSEISMRLANEWKVKKEELRLKTKEFKEQADNIKNRLL